MRQIIYLIFSSETGPDFEIPQFMQGDSDDSAKHCARIFCAVLNVEPTRPFVRCTAHHPEVTSTLHGNRDFHELQQYRKEKCEILHCYSLLYLEPNS